MSSKLPNYLRTHRKRVGFSQDEVAFLMGSISGTRIIRYERFHREPPLRAALALEVILRRPVAELFGGMFDQVERTVLRRAKTLGLRMNKAKPGRHAKRKTESLRAMFKSQ